LKPGHLRVFQISDLNSPALLLTSESAGGNMARPRSTQAKYYAGTTSFTTLNLHK
jgi:hypothetical protein